MEEGTLRERSVAETISKASQVLHLHAKEDTINDCSMVAKRKPIQLWFTHY